MADDAIIIEDANAVDRNVDTRTIGTDHRQVVVIGDPATGAGVAPVDATTGLTINGNVQVADGAVVADVLDLTNANPLTVAVVNASGDQITSFGGSGGTAEVDDAAFTAASDSGTPIMGFVTSDSVDTDDVGVVAMTAARALKIDVASSSLDTAHGDVDANMPVKIGSQARSTWPASVSDGDRANAVGDLVGRLLAVARPPELQKSYHVNYTTAQTGTVIWTPASGRRIVVESVIISTYSTTGGKITLFFDDDTTYNAGTDQPVVVVNFIPSATVYPGAAPLLSAEVACLNADYSLRITTSAGISVDVTVHGYEV